MLCSEPSGSHESHALETKREAASVPQCTLLVSAGCRRVPTAQLHKMNGPFFPKHILPWRRPLLPRQPGLLPAQRYLCSDITVHLSEPQRSMEGSCQV